MFISFIVPAFNVESLIERCIDSICTQNLSPDKYEVIIINDGSTDNTLSVINGLIAKYSNRKIILIDKANGGLSSARNIGLSHASGKYVWFIDSDDYIADNCLESIYQDIHNHNELDLLAFNMEYAYDDGTASQNRRRLSAEKYITGSELYLQDFRYPYSGVQFSIYRHSYLKSLGLLFKKGVVFEDILYTTLLLASNPKCLFVDRTYYHYSIRLGSITNSKSSVKKCLNLLLVADDLYSNIDRYNSAVLYDQIARIAPLLYRYHMSGLCINDKIEVIKQILKREYWHKSILASKKYKYIPYLLLNALLRPFVS